MKYVALFYLLTFSYYVNASTLTGSWRVDADKTLAFEKNTLQRTSLHKDLLTCSVRNSGWYFSDDGKSRIFMNSHSCSHQGKTAEINGYIINFTFYVLSSSNMQTIIQADNAFEDQPITIHWESENMFWFESTYNAITTRYFYTK